MSILLDGMKQQRAQGILSALEDQAAQTVTASPAPQMPTLAPLSEDANVAHNFVQLNSAPISQKMSHRMPVTPSRSGVMLAVGTGIVLLSVAVGALWWVGHDDVSRMEAETAALTEQIVAQQGKIDAMTLTETVSPPAQTAVVPVNNIEQQTISSVAPVEVKKAPMVNTVKAEKQVAIAAPRAVAVEPVVAQDVNRSGVLLADAGDAFRAGHFQQAIQLYRQVIDKQPKHKQALLGLLASLQSISAPAVDVDRVQNDLMRYYPYDADVNMLVFDQLSNNAESLLKGWIQNNPKHALLHYKLGAYYVSQSRWAEAQTSFFDAVSLDKQQAEYLANLAIAYDHLGKRVQAIEYYQSALSVAAAYPKRGGMNIQALNERLRYLQSVQE
jgi:Flp pilus assembly protein TadD